tara:strand:- start:429 stop:1046 length:618 start_codon:yes stop_codon:yes gene_type:complete
VKVGIDFDNTIVSYDSLFYKVALELGVIPEEIDRTKISVRDFLRKNNKNDIWTSIQGMVYGEKMIEAEVYEGFIEFIKFLKSEKFDFCIISHKTKYPFIGKKTNLHNAALNWIQKFLNIDNQILIKDELIYFEDTKELKVDRIISEKCDVFIDDLPEIFEIPSFPDFVNKYLFDPNETYVGNQFLSFSSWLEIKNEFEKCVIKKK